jgi:cellulose synthase/poly-beta-1,6-N-acetylglucosamine synthase-like glycosyltransferase
MIYYVIAFFLLTALYVTTLLVLRKGLFRIKRGVNQPQPEVSVIIAARNEERHIHKCLTAILNQTYPKNKYEIIVIDDRSEDRTAEIVRSAAVNHRQISLLQIKDSSPQIASKKRAIDLGIRNAKGKIIVTTDADCRPGPCWISELVKYFEPDVGLVAGFNPYKTETSQNPIFHQMLALDYFAMACVAAASAGLGYPMSCSGGNLAYRKEVYLQIGGFNNISNWVSGDDDFFLEQVRQNTNWKIRYAAHPKTFVPTEPPENVEAFIHQRIRYASKSRHYKTPVTLALVMVYLLNFLLLLGLLLLCFSPKFLPIWFAGYLTKTMAEFTFLKKGQKVFQMQFKSFVFLLTAVLHPIYIVLAGLLGQVANFQWKGVNYSAKIEEAKIS